MLLQNSLPNTHPAILPMLVFAMLAVLASAPVVAADKNTLLSEESAKELLEDNDGAISEQTLEHNFSPEDRARLRKALADYAKNSDPEHVQIENKRKLMKESIQERFVGCDEDADDSLDREETTECLPQVARHFNFVDVDENGVITLEELELAQAKSLERQKAAEARIEARKILEAEAAIKNKSKLKANKQAVSQRKNPS